MAARWEPDGEPFTPPPTDYYTSEKVVTTLGTGGTDLAKLSLGGIISTIGKIGTGILGGLGIGGPIGGVIGGIAGGVKIGGGGSTPFPMVPHTGKPGVMPDLPGVNIGGTQIDPWSILPGGKPFIQTGIPGAGGFLPAGYHVNKEAVKAAMGRPNKGWKNVIVKNRHTNYANGKALNRAISRGRGFIRVSKRAAKAFGFKVVKA